MRAFWLEMLWEKVKEAVVKKIFLAIGTLMGAIPMILETTLLASGMDSTKD
jgi:hypothetical protein